MHRPLQSFQSYGPHGELLFVGPHEPQPRRPRLEVRDLFLAEHPSIHLHHSEPLAISIPKTARIADPQQRYPPCGSCYNLFHVAGAGLIQTGGSQSEVLPPKG
jgi:hypothetical protein